MKHVYGAVGCVIVGLGLTALSHAADLTEVYRQALQSAPTLKLEQAVEKSELQAVPLGWSALLPQVSTSASVARENTNSNVVSNVSYNQSILGASLKQSLINFNYFATLRAAYHDADAARDTYQFVLQEFIISVAQAYFNVLEAQDNVRFAESKEEFLQKTLVQTRDKYRVGLSAITDLKQAEANYYAAVADSIQAKNTLANDWQKLQVLTGQPETALAGLRQNFPFTSPVPDDIDQWVQQAVKHNHNLISARYKVDAAHDEVLAAVGNQLPTLGLDVDYTRTQYSDNVPASVATSSKVDNLQVILVLTWNIFSGGELWAKSLQSARTYVAGRATTDLTYRQVINLTRQDYLSVIAAVKQVQAFKQAVISGELSLKQFQAKYEAGVETIIGVLDQLQTLYEAKQQLAQAEYTYIITALRLKQDAGTLTVKDLEKINQWLQVGSVVSP